MKINEITEAVNQAVFKRGFEKTATVVGKTNGTTYTLKATPGAMPYIPGKKSSVSDQFRIEAYDGPAQVGWVNFENIDGNLEALDLVVTQEHRRQGIAAAMYDFAKSLDNSISPSAKQTPDGKAFWSGKK